MAGGKYSFGSGGYFQSPIDPLLLLESLRGCTVAAIQAVMGWKYRPASRGGESIAVYSTESVFFGRSDR